MTKDVAEITVTISSGTALSEAFAMEYFVRGNFYMPAAWTAAGLGFQVYHNPTGTFVPLVDLAGDEIEAAVFVDTAVPLPDGLAACRWVKLWSQTAGTGVNQGADRVFVIELKD